MKTSWLRSAPLLALNIAFWLAYAVMVGVLWVVGLPLIWWAARKHNTKAEPSVVWPEKMVFRWRSELMNTIWGNEQDGVNGVPLTGQPSLSWWPEYYRQHGYSVTVFQWSALRNSTNNLRFMHYFVPWLGWINPNTIEPKRIRWCGTDAPLNAVLSRWATAHMESDGDGSVMVEAGGYRRRVACLFVSQGLYAGLRIAVRFRGRAHQIWFGWKLNPGMAVGGWWPDDPCWKGVGFTCGQVRHSA